MSTNRSSSPSPPPTSPLLRDGLEPQRRQDAMQSQNVPPHPTLPSKPSFVQLQPPPPRPEAERLAHQQVLQQQQQQQQQMIQQHELQQQQMLQEHELHQQQVLQRHPQAQPLQQLQGQKRSNSDSQLLQDDAQQKNLQNGKDANGNIASKPTLRTKADLFLHIFWPPGRTWLSIVLLILVLWFMASMGAASDRRVPSWYRPLRDVGHEVFGPWNINVHSQDYVLAVEIILSFLYGLFIYNGPVPRVVILRRFILVLSWLYFFRGVVTIVTTMPPTVVPCDLQASKEMSVLKRVAFIVRHNSLTCSDLMYSGHTSIAFLMSRFMEFYAVSPCPQYRIGRKIIVVLWWIMGGLVFFLSFATQNHHTGDVTMAALMAWGYTTIFHLCIKLIAERRKERRANTALVNGDIEQAERNLGKKSAINYNGRDSANGPVPAYGSGHPHPTTEILIDRETEETRGSDAHTHQSAIKNPEGVNKPSRRRHYDLDESLEPSAQFYGPYTLLAFIEWIDRT